MYCENCGKELETGTKFCPVCGTFAGKSPEMQFYNGQPGMYQQNYREDVLEGLYKKEKISLYIWIGIVCYQVLAGFLIPSAWGFALWNSFACYQTYKFGEQIKKYPVGIYAHYENALTADIIFLVLNLLLGGVIAAAGAGYDLYVRQYAMDHKDSLLQIEEKYRMQNTNTNTAM